MNVIDSPSACEDIVSRNPGGSTLEIGTGSLHTQTTEASAATASSPPDVRAFLRTVQAEAMPHSGASLLDHLEGVERLLIKWNAPSHVCLAGLFHSVYGTEAFRRAVVRPGDRNRVREVIGTQAERLVHLFCGMRMTSFFTALDEGAPYRVQMRWSEDRTESLTDTEMRDLGLVIAANWLEQFDRMRGGARASRIANFRGLSEWLGGAAGQAITDAYGFGHAGLEIVRTPATIDAADKDRIEVWDDAVPQVLQVRLTGLMDMNIWRYGWRATAEQSAYGFWHSHFAGDDDNGVQSCEHDLLGRPLIAPVLELWRMLEAGPLKGHIPVRVYANGHTFGGDGHLHTDHSAPDHFTTIYYAHAQWGPNWAGETVFFSEGRDDVIASVFPRPGRLAHFPGSIPHAARSPGRDCPALRAVIVFKTRLALSPDEPQAAA